MWRNHHKTKIFGNFFMKQLWISKSSNNHLKTDIYLKYFWSHFVFINHRWRYSQFATTVIPHIVGWFVSPSWIFAQLHQLCATITFRRGLQTLQKWVFLKRTRRALLKNIYFRYAATPVEKVTAPRSWRLSKKICFWRSYLSLSISLGHFLRKRV